MALSMAVILVAIALGRNFYLAGLKPPQSPAAASAVIDTVTANLRDAVRLILLLAVVVAVVAFAAGNAWVRAKVGAMGKPGWATGGPFHDFVSHYRRVLQWGILALGLVILVIWSNPTTLVAVVVVLIALALVGLVGRSPDGVPDRPWPWRPGPAARPGTARGSDGLRLGRPAAVAVRRRHPAPRPDGLPALRPD